MIDSYYFIINPNSGSRRDAFDIAEALKSAFAAKARLHVAFTSHQGHALELARGAIAEGYKAIVLAGGDGTVNEVLPAVCGTDIMLGLIPKGSGNGLAREFAIPLNPRAAVEAFASYRPRRIDAGRVNGEYFINVAGLGVDAMIGRAFNVFGKKGPRGRAPYYYFGLKEGFAYKPFDAELDCDGRALRARPLCLAFANGRQFGGGAIIAPRARPDDGLLHVVLIEYQPWYRLLRNLPALFAGTIDKVPFVTTMTGRRASVRVKGEIVYQLDGEARTAQGALSAEIVPGAISFLVPQ